MRGRSAAGTPDWIKLLNRLALAEMFVPYDNGRRRIYDISDWHLISFPLVQVKNDADGKTFLSTSSVTPPQIFDEFIVAEVQEDGVRWIENKVLNPAAVRQV